MQRFIARSTFGFSAIILVLQAWAACLNPAYGQWEAIQTVERNAPPQVLPSHPGNIFFQGEQVTIPIPESLQGKVARWNLLDDRLQPVELDVKNALKPNGLSFGTLPIGWYRVEFLDADGKLLDFTTAACLAKLAAPVPQDSPVCLDVAVSWLSRDKSDKKKFDADQAEKLVNLASLTGINWIRDRITWREMQSGPGESVESTKYDDMAESQTVNGMKVLQTFHTVPRWARDELNPDRADLRQLYQFCKAMAKRFKGKVHAWEPWNEGNAKNFGGFTIDELCSLQKAAYLGFKAGDPDVTVCWNPFGGITTEHLADGVLRNEAWPYYDVYCIHSYDWPHAFENLWGHARRASAGRPIWVTEADRGMKAAPDSELGDYTHEDAIKKAQLIPQEHARSFFSGAVRHFHFILCDYMEGRQRVQFGLLRHDNTPRPSYVALAAAGRFLAGAECFGRYELVDKQGAKQPDLHVYAFRGQPDGKQQDVLIAWSEKEVDWPGRGKQTVDWKLPSEVQVKAVYDYLGRPLGETVPSQLTSSPIYLVLPPGEASKLPLRTVASEAIRKFPEPSPVVLQLQIPNEPLTPRNSRTNPWTQEQTRVFKPGEKTKCVVVATNFSDVPVSGVLRLEEVPEGWEFSEVQWNVKLKPMAKAELDLSITRPTAQPECEPWITLRGDFGPAGTSVLSFEASSQPKQ